jgi:ankyrin repeat protein
MLLGNGADFNLKTKSGDTVLLTATGQGHNAIVQLLLDQANPQLKPKPGT